MQAHSTIRTEDEWAALVSQKNEQADAADTIVLQVGADWCQHCRPVAEELASLSSEFVFDSLYTDASDSELLDFFSCTRLPTLIIYHPSLPDPIVVQSARVSHVKDILKQYCRPKLVLDDDF